MGDQQLTPASGMRLAVEHPNVARGHAYDSTGYNRS
jgi:hypothetical protein